MRAKLKTYTRSEEHISGAIHLFGAGLMLIALVVLVVHAIKRGSSAAMVAGCSIFALSAMCLYSMSGVYHILPAGKAKRVFKVLDHSAIFVLISGTYTPFLLALGTRNAVIVFFAQWVLTLGGILFKTKFAGKSPSLSTLIYLAMGWMIVLIFGDVKAMLDATTIWLLIAGGLSYSLGTIFYLMKKVNYTHAIWHLFVLGGTLFHFFAVYRLV